MSLFVDILFITSVVLFVLGVLGVFVKPFNVKFRLRYYFIASLLCFSLSLALGWEDFVKGFNDGMKDAKSISSDTEQVDE